MKKVIVLCNVQHDIEEGVCALCERDEAIRDARRYRALRRMVGVLNVELGRIPGLHDHDFTVASAEDIRRALDEELDRRAALLDANES